MTRRKPKKVDQVVHDKSGVTVNICLAPSAGLSFMAELPDGKVLRNSNGNELKQEVIHWLDENTALEFFPVIELVEGPYGQRYSQDNMIGIELERFHFAKKKSGNGMLKKDWEGGQATEFNPAWLNSSEFNPPVKRRGLHGQMTYYLPYSEDLWDTLNRLQDTLKDLKGVLREVLGQPADDLLIIDLIDLKRTLLNALVQLEKSGAIEPKQPKIGP